MDQIILVDKNDKEIGYDTKEACHYKKPKLHRAFSIFIFNGKGEMLVTKRSAEKKTWPLFWSNAVCSHPRQGESTEKAAQRRLKEELGTATDLRFLFKFEYSAQYDKDWGEHEMDYVFTGEHNGPFYPDKSEVAEWKFMKIIDLEKDMKNNSDSYTPWFKIAFGKVLKNMQ